MGMLMQLAAATAQKGTKRPISGGASLVKELRPRAVTRAPPVAQTYDMPNWDTGIGVAPLLFE